MTLYCRRPPTVGTPPCEARRCRCRNAKTSASPLPARTRRAGAPNGARAGPRLPASRRQPDADRVTAELTAGRSPEAIWPYLDAEGAVGRVRVETFYMSVYACVLDVTGRECLRMRPPWPPPVPAGPPRQTRPRGAQQRRVGFGSGLFSGGEADPIVVVRQGHNYRT